MTNEPRRAGERLVAARAEERRRLRRDLHDGLGPLVGGIALEVRLASDLVESDLATARDLLDRLPGEIRDAIVDIRQTVHGVNVSTAYERRTEQALEIADG